MTATDLSSTLPKRPGGLTALAVLNIVFALIGGLGGLMMTTFERGGAEMARAADNVEYAIERGDMDRNGGNPEMNRAIARGMAAQMRRTSPEAYRWMMAIGSLGGVLLFIAGIGFLGQRRYGRYAANAAGVALIACGTIAMMKLGFLFWGFPMLGAGYAVVLLLMVQFAYRPTLSR